MWGKNKGKKTRDDIVRRKENEEGNKTPNEGIRKDNQNKI